MFFFQKGENCDTELTKTLQLVGEENEGRGAGDAPDVLQSLQQPHKVGTPEDDADKTLECDVSMSVCHVDQVCLG